MTKIGRVLGGVAALLALSCGGAGDGSNAEPGSGAGGVDVSTCTAQALPFGAMDADYSAVLDRIVAVIGPSLKLLDPTTLDVVSVPLPSEGWSVSVGPDGLSAAVSHRGSVSVVDLTSETPTATLPIGVEDEGDVVMGNGFVYVLPHRSSGSWVTVHSIDIATGFDQHSETVPNEAGNHIGQTISPGSRIKLHPGGQYLYGVEQISSWDLTRWSVAEGNALNPARPDPPEQASSLVRQGDLWLSQGGEQLVTSSGGVFTVTPGSSADLAYAGALGNDDSSGAKYSALAHEARGKHWYAGVPLKIGGTEASVMVFDAASHGVQRTIALPCLVTETERLGAAAQADYLFASADGLRVYALVASIFGGYNGLVVLPTQ